MAILRIEGYGPETQPGEVTVITVESREAAEEAAYEARKAADEAAKSLGATIVSAAIADGRLILTQADGIGFDAGPVSTAAAQLAAANAEQSSSNAATSASDAATARQAAIELVANAAGIASGAVVSGKVTGDDLVLVKKNGEEFVAGSVRGPQGLAGPNTIPTKEVIDAALGVTVMGGSIQGGTLMLERGDKTKVSAGNVTGLPDGVLGTKRFDSVRGTYNESPSTTRRMRAALAQTRTALFRVMCVGDSTVFGANATPPQSKQSWPSRLAQMLASVEGHASSTGAVDFQNYSLASEPRFVFAGTWAAANVGPFNTAGRQSNVPASKVTFTPDIEVDAFVVRYATGPDAGTWSYSVDGGAATNVDSSAAAAGYSTVTVPASSTGVHSLVIAVGAGGFTRLISVEGRNGLTGSVVTRAGKGGAMASSFVVGASLGLAGSIGTIDALSPNLVILGFGVNEYLNQVALASYKANLQTILTRAISVGADVVMLTAVPNQDTTKAISQAQYRQVVYELADANNAMVLDVAYLWDSYAVSNAAPLSLYGDVTHPNSRGYFDIAAAIYAAITGGGRVAPLAGATTPVAPPVEVYAADSFSAADGALSVTEVGAKSYTALSAAGGSWARSAGQLACSKLAVSTAPILQVGSVHAGGVISAKLVTATNDGILFRMAAVNSWLGVLINGGVYKLYQNSGGTLAALATSAVVPALNDEVKIRDDGSTVQVFINGVRVPSLDLETTFNASATGDGFWAGGSVARTAVFDDYRHEALA